MYHFECDYTEGCIPEILEAISAENLTQYCGYSEDEICDRARARIKACCGGADVDVHFLVGGTQANTTIISAALRPYQGVISAAPGHIACHETGAIEATGHKVLALPSENGRLNGNLIRRCCKDHWDDSSHEHQVQPAMVYLSHPAENGSLYSLAELEDIRRACDEWNLTLFVDGARLGYGLVSPINDVSLPDLARLTDVFYIGGTKVGALFGEAVVIRNPQIKQDFRYMIKRHGGMLAKGWLLGLQFDKLFEDNRYLTIAKHAVEQALRIKEALEQKHCPLFMESWTNQQFPILDNETMHKFDGKYAYSIWAKIDDDHTAIRFCTSWATRKEAVDELIADIQTYL